ncbi:hypothetical protein E5288_WYG014524 [Bos mutus]|uniref:Uncharacterized protein n=1 Tax=Bos mutus TaxID=72004 RepID=A0A6B0R1F1_9CETA|nr:hypothetical protein [Bos mutus]
MDEKGRTILDERDIFQLLVEKEGIEDLEMGRTIDEGFMDSSHSIICGVFPNHSSLGIALDLSVYSSACPMRQFYESHKLVPDPQTTQIQIVPALSRTAVPKYHTSLDIPVDKSFHQLCLRCVKYTYIFEGMEIDKALCPISLNSGKNKIWKIR